MGDPDEASITFKALAKPVESALVAPDQEVFNSSAINPTVEVYVGACEDVDQNGILDAAELEACTTVEEDSEDDKKEGGEPEAEGE